MQIRNLINRLGLTALISLDSSNVFAYDRSQFIKDMGAAAQIIWDGGDCITELNQQLDLNKILEYLAGSKQDYFQAEDYAATRPFGNNLYSAHLLVFEIINTAVYYTSTVSDKSPNFNLRYCPADSHHRHVIGNNFLTEREFYNYPG